MKWQRARVLNPIYNKFNPADRFEPGTLLWVRGRPYDQGLRDKTTGIVSPAYDAWRPGGGIGVSARNVELLPEFTDDPARTEVERPA